MPALFADGVFKIEQLLTVLTFEELHNGSGLSPRLNVPTFLEDDPACESFLRFDPRMPIKGCR
jgi:hypothetical protein